MRWMLLIMCIFIFFELFVSIEAASSCPPHGHRPIRSLQMHKNSQTKGQQKVISASLRTSTSYSSVKVLLFNHFSQIFEVIEVTLGLILQFMFEMTD